MGYLTQYELTVVESKKEDETDYIKELRNSIEEAKYALDCRGHCSDSCKWYEWQDDMLAFSELHPTATFHLSGTGEDSGDMWRATFLGGKMHKRDVQITFEPYDPAKLE